MSLKCFLIIAYFQPHVSYRHVSCKKSSVQSMSEMDAVTLTTILFVLRVMSPTEENVDELFLILL